MNCKQGDLAIITAKTGTKEHQGKIVRCTANAVPVVTHGAPGPWWITEPALFAANGAEIYWQDKSLKPIRPQRNDATDEMIQLLGTPKKETA